MLKGDNVQGILGMISPFGAKWRWDESRGAQVFLFGNKPRNLSATLQPPIFTKFGHETYFGVPLRNPERHLVNFHFRDHLAPQL